MAAHDLGPTLKALLPPVAISVGASLAGLFAVRALVPFDFLQKTNDVVGNYLQTIGTIYAVLLAFVVFVVWSQYNDARLRVEAEANELLDLARTARGVTGKACARLRSHLREYVGQVLDGEWKSMAAGDARGFEHGQALLEAMWNHLASIQPKDDREVALYSEMLARFNDFSDARTERLTSAVTRIPRVLTLLLHFGAMSTIGSMYLFAVESAAVHSVLVGLLAFSISHVLYIVRDLDDCFGGVWRVPKDSFERVAHYLHVEEKAEHAAAAGGRAT